MERSVREPSFEDGTSAHVGHDECVERIARDRVEPVAQYSDIPLMHQAVDGGI
ncbi:hypothetical protein SDC9_210370 [bioreactor metagenome]|uniref:Uncharacterized protein n=1 Tax=bioreactor metagenome TaxID=1076179 RepID=A0A645JFZ0_9ZZZZ